MSSLVSTLSSTRISSSCSCSTCQSISVWRDPKIKIRFLDNFYEELILQNQPPFHLSTTVLTTRILSYIKTEHLIQACPVLDDKGKDGHQREDQHEPHVDCLRLL